MELALVSFVCVQIIFSLATPDKYYLSKIDSLIYEKLTNPVPGEGDPVLDSIHIYTQLLNNTIQVYMNNRTGQDVVDILIEEKGPKCVTPYIRDDLLIDRFEWGVQELGELYYMLNSAKMLWRDFRYYLVTALGYEIDPLPIFVTTTEKGSTPQ